MKKRIPTKTWTKLTTKELAAATREFDDPSYMPPAVEMPAELKGRHRKALSSLRSKARRAGKTARVSILLEPHLLQRADALAQEKGLSRSEIVSRGLQMLLKH